MFVIFIYLEIFVGYVHTVGISAFKHHIMADVYVKPFFIFQITQFRRHETIHSVNSKFPKPHVKKVTSEMGQF